MKIFGKILSIVCIVSAMFAGSSCTKQIQMDEDGSNSQGIVSTGNRIVTLYAPGTPETKTIIGSDTAPGAVNVLWKTGDNITLYGLTAGGEYEIITRIVLESSNILNGGQTAEVSVPSNILEGYESFIASNCGSTTDGGTSPEPNMVSTYCTGGYLHVNIDDYLFDGKTVTEADVFGLAHVALGIAGEDLSFHFKHQVNFLELYIDEDSFYANGYVQQLDGETGDKGVIVNDGALSLVSTWSTMWGGNVKLHPGTNYIPFFPTQTEEPSYCIRFYITDEATDQLIEVYYPGEDFDWSSYGKINYLGDVTKLLPRRVEIGSWEDLINFKRRLEGGECFRKCEIDFTNDLYASDFIYSYTPIFDRDGHNLDNAYINGNDCTLHFPYPIPSMDEDRIPGYGALFNCVSSTGLTIEGLTIEFESDEILPIDVSGRTGIYSGAFIQKIDPYDPGVDPEELNPIFLGKCFVNRAHLVGNACGGLIGANMGGYGGLKIEACEVRQCTIETGDFSEEVDSLAFFFSSQGYKENQLWCFGGGLIGASLHQDIDLSNYSIDNCAVSETIIEGNGSKNITGAFIGATSICRFGSTSFPSALRIGAGIVQNSILKCSDSEFTEQCYTQREGVWGDFITHTIGLSKIASFFKLKNGDDYNNSHYLNEDTLGITNE